MTERKNLLDTLTEGRTLPEGYDTWGIKSTNPDLTTRGGYRWPFPGQETEVLTLDDHDRSCPRRKGDGLCVATTWAGMASGGFPAATLLLVAFRASEARGDERGKLRVPQAYVVDLVDGARLVREHGRDAYLQGAYLQGANLQRADLQRANLWGAYLQGADLRSAYLQGADLRGANLWGADLQGADLRSADLQRADLRGAYLWGADLQGAYLQGASASPYSTVWPKGFNPAGRI